MFAFAVGTRAWWSRCGSRCRLTSALARVTEKEVPPGESFHERKIFMCKVFAPCGVHEREQLGAVCAKEPRAMCGKRVPSRPMRVALGGTRPGMASRKHTL
jgi:hypothetical protein